MGFQRKCYISGTKITYLMQSCTTLSRGELYALLIVTLSWESYTFVENSYFFVKIVIKKVILEWKMYTSVVNLHFSGKFTFLWKIYTNSTWKFKLRWRFTLRWKSSLPCKMYTFVDNLHFCWQFTHLWKIYIFVEDLHFYQKLTISSKSRMIINK